MYIVLCSRLKREFKLTSSWAVYISGENHKHHIRFIVADVWCQDVDIVAVDIAAAVVAVDDNVDRMIAAVAVPKLTLLLAVVVVVWTTTASTIWVVPKIVAALVDAAAAVLVLVLCYYGDDAVVVVVAVAVVEIR